jgi:hypothetical protein
MDFAILGVVLDSSTVITAARQKLPVPRLIEAIQAAQRRRRYIEELVDLVPVHPVTT